MTLHKLTVVSHQQDFLLPANAPMTDIEYEPNGKNIIPFGCRMGACGACVVRVIEGHEQLSEQDADEVAFINMLGYSGADYRLACQCRLKGEATVEVVA